MVFSQPLPGYAWHSNQEPINFHGKENSSMIMRTSFLSITILVMVFCHSGKAVDNSAVLYFSFGRGKGMMSKTIP